MATQRGLGISGDSVTTTLTAGAPVIEVARPDGRGGPTTPINYVLIQSDVLAAFQPIAAGETPALAAMSRVLPAAPLIVSVASFASILLRRVAADAQVTITPLDNLL